MNAKRQLSALLVDDEAYFRKFVGQVLKQEGVAAVEEASNGREGLDFFQAAKPNLVLLDINMPHLNGVDALKEFRKMSADVPIIMLTSISEESVVEECVKHGASYFIRKDVRADQLRGELQAMLKEFFGEPPA